MTATCTVLTCGDASRADDGAAIAAIGRLTEDRRQGVRVRLVGQLEPEDVLEALLAGRCIVVDAVRGVEPGEVIEIPLRSLGATGGPQPASSHAMPIAIVIGLAEALGADLDNGVFVGIGGRSFELGSSLSVPVEAGLGALAAAVDQRIRASATEVERPCV
jgi:hydrogenase maturation protease